VLNRLTEYFEIRLSPYTLLVGMKNVSASWENDLSVFQKVEKDDPEFNS
jgi:hypothetical protein